mmetsp:Transcript_26912/g.79538  ORF Transcript_26912/g.79538 Transcript_26912/m.79538 type:complete len:93 (-) Transcript_26912:39-317(-)
MGRTPGFVPCQRSQRHRSALVPFAAKRGSNELGDFSDLADCVAGQLLCMDYGLALTGIASAPLWGDDAGEGEDNAVIPNEDVAVTLAADKSS